MFPNLAINGAIVFFVFALFLLCFKLLSHKIAFSLKCEISIRVWLAFHQFWPVSSAGSANWCFFTDSSQRAAIFFPHLSDQCIVVVIS